jgi:hypothetical protein
MCRAQIAKFRASSSKHIVEGLQQVARQVADILGVPASGACLAGAGRISDDGLSVIARLTLFFSVFPPFP